MRGSISTLTYWRRRLAASGRPDRIFEAVRSVVAGTGVLHGKAMRALDSVVLEDAVATQDTVTQLIAAIRRVCREVPGAAAVIAEQCRAHDYADPGKPAIAWDDQAARDALVSALVADATTVTDAFAAAGLEGRAAEAVALLALIAGQDVEPAEGSDGTDGRWRIARTAQDRVSACRPRGPARPQDGHRRRTASKPTSRSSRHRPVHRRSSPRPAVDSHEACWIWPAEDAGPLQVLGDTAYGTGQARADLAEAGHTAVIKPGPLRPAVPGGFTIDDFTIDETAGTATCPNGVTRLLTADPARRVRHRLPRLPFAGALHDLPRRARRCGCTPAMRSCGRPAVTGQPATICATSTGSTGPWSSGPSPGSSAPRAAAGSSATAASPGTTSGCTCGWPPSTSAA